MPGTGAPSLTNVQSLMELSSLVRKDRATDARSLMAFTNAVTIDFSKYARAELLGDGSAKQQLRKLEDDFLIATQELSQAQIKLAGTERLYSSNFVTKTELDSDKLSVKRSEVKVAASQTALDLYNKYEFAKAAEEFVSKYDESLRSLERSRKEAISKLAQARARLKSAEGRFRIGTEQLQELYQQMSNCVIRAQRPGLVVYGRGDDRRFSGPEEQIREGATVRERQSIITIPDMTHMAVKLKIHESHIKKVKKGLKARIQVDAFPNEKLDGEVLKVGVLPDSQDRWMNPDMKVYVTSVAVEGMHEWLKPGMSAKVEILVQELPDVIYVPIQAIVPMKGKQYCFVANGGAPEERGVEVGEFNDEFIEIKRGLKEGERSRGAPEGVEKDTVGPEEGLEEESTGGGPVRPDPAWQPRPTTSVRRPAVRRPPGPGPDQTAPNKLRITNYQLPVTSHQSPVTSHQSPVTPETMSASSIVRLENVSKTYEMGLVTVQALRGVSLHIQAGEYISIMGPSGCGKSTLLNLLGCLDRPTSGRYLLGGEDVSQMDDDTLSSVRGARLGFIFQSYNLVQQMTVVENIEIPLYYQGRPEHESRARAQELAARVGLGERFNHRPDELSGGQQQRVAIARALVNDPLVILADEPTGNLDSTSGAEILEVFDELSRQGKTLIMVTHDESIAHRATRTIHFRDGIVESDVRH